MTLNVKLRQNKTKAKYEGCVMWGKTNLTDGVEWECPTNAAHRFFKVKVEMP